jgi:hypothetical protein
MVGKRKNGVLTPGQGPGLLLWSPMCGISYLINVSTSAAFLSRLERKRERFWWFYSLQKLSIMAEKKSEMMRRNSKMLQHRKSFLISVSESLAHKKYISTTLKYKL